MNEDGYLRKRVLAEFNSRPGSPNKIQVDIECFEGPEGRGPGTIMRRLINSNATDADQKVGLVVLDFKGDETVEFIRSAAAAAGRAADVRVLSLDSAAGYDFFSGCKTLEDVAEYAERLTFGSGRVEAQENFWDQYRASMFRAALTWLVLNHSADRTFSTWMAHASSWLLADSIPAELDDDLQLLRDRCEKMPAGSAERLVVQHALQLIDGWDGRMDSRTRSNVRAVLDLAMRPLLEPSVLKLMRRTPSHPLRIASAVEKGRIVVVSIPAMQHPELASLVARCVKADYYRSVFSRKPGGRLVMLVGDEYHLAVTAGNARFEDSLGLPLMRSQRAGLVVATQTLAGIDRVIGNLNRRVLLGNFGTVFFLRSTEAEVEAWAQQVCGTVEIDITERVLVRDSRSDGGLAECYERILTRKGYRFVCGSGALARLETGQAYVLREGTASSPHPVWFAGGP